VPAADRATGKDIILDIVENMRAYQEELLYSSVVPTAFEVHLHPDDYDRLEGIFPAIQAEARRALDEELARQNRRPGPEWLRRLTRPAGPTQAAHDSWSVTFFRDENEELRPGEVLIDSRLTVPQGPELGAGTRTRRITTSRIGQQSNTRSQVIDEPAATAPIVPSPPASADDRRPEAQSAVQGTAATAVVPPPLPLMPEVEAAPSTAAAPAPMMPSADATVRTGPAAAASVFATLTYEDNSGRHTRDVTEPQLVIGRGGAGYWVDLRIDAAQDVSREHVKLRRDAATGQFFLKDVSLYGTTVNGRRVASSIDTSTGGKRDINVEVPLPPVARIGLADMVFIDFRVANAS
jgi:hypothetical protein